MGPSLFRMGFSSHAARFSFGPPAAHEDKAIVVAGTRIGSEGGARTRMRKIIDLNMYCCKIWAVGVWGFDLMELPERFC